METPKVPDTARSEMSLIGESVVIKGELSCSENLYIGGQVEGAIELKGNCLTVGPNGRVKGNVNARGAVRQYSCERSGRLKAVRRRRGRHRDSAHLH